jgi:hypothetical protein
MPHASTNNEPKNSIETIVAVTALALSQRALRAKKSHVRPRQADCDRKSQKCAEKN